MKDWSIWPGGGRTQQKQINKESFYFSSNPFWKWWKFFDYSSISCFWRRAFAFFFHFFIFAICCPILILKLYYLIYLICGMRRALLSGTKWFHMKDLAARREQKICLLNGFKREKPFFICIPPQTEPITPESLIDVEIHAHDTPDLLREKAAFLLSSYFEIA